METSETTGPVASFKTQQPRELTPEERQRILVETIQFFAEECDRDPAEITRESDLENDLQMDSLSFLELFEELRTRYDFDVDVQAVVRYARQRHVRTLGELVDEIFLFLEQKIDLESLAQAGA